MAKFFSSNQEKTVDPREKDRDLQFPTVRLAGIENP
jgi:hypothetical protein